MTSRDRPFRHRLALLPAILAVAGLYLLLHLYDSLQGVLLLWLLVSFPIGTIMGHCVLSEE